MAERITHIIDEPNRNCVMLSCYITGTGTLRSGFHHGPWQDHDGNLTVMISPACNVDDMSSNAPKQYSGKTEAHSFTGLLHEHYLRNNM